MGDEQLLDLAKQFLQTPEGQKVLADQIDVNSLEQRLLELESSNLSREEKRNLRRERRETRREIRQQLREDRREKRREEIFQLRAKLKSNIPVIRQFTIKGRLYDKQTGKPLEGVEIKALEAIIFKGGKEGRQDLRNQRQAAREERQDIREDSFAELEKLRQAARDENKLQREYDQEARKLNNSLTQEEINKRGKALSEGRAAERSFDTNKAAYFGGFLENDSEGNPTYYGRYSSKKLTKAERALENFKSQRKTQLANTRVSKYKTDKDGNFELILSAVVLPSQVTVNIKDEETGEKIEKTVSVRDYDTSILRPKLIYTHSGYAPSTQEVINLDKTIKSDLSTFSLYNIDAAAQQAKADIQNTMDEGKAALNSIYLDGVEILIVAKRKSIMRVVDIIKTRLVPLAIGMLIAFGITKLTQKSQKTCPSPDQLKDVIRRRNSIVRQLNQIFTAVAVNSALAAAFLAISQAVRSARRTVDGIPLPLAIGVPPAKDFGGLISAQPYSTVAKLQNVKDLLKDLEESNKDLNKQILIALVFLVTALTIILLLLKDIDNLIEDCSEDDEIPFEEIEEELLDLTQETEEEGTPVITDINGFILSVETLKNTPGELKRRQAIAKDTRGVTLLKGEPSFASSDQILIDELVFYIQQNNLKAN